MINKLIQYESSGGILLFLAAVLAMILANSALSPYYGLLIDLPLAIHIGDFNIAKPLLLWINDGLMAVFFFLVGLELKRELVEGELSDRKNIILPGVGAIGGMAIPAFIYLGFNHTDPVAMHGWAIPAATDIAFALGVLALLGSRVPVAFKVFLTSLAIIDDIGAIVIIALFYTSKISMAALVVVFVCTLVLFILNRRNSTSMSAYVIVGVIMWVAMLKSGVHATLAGVLLASFIPMRDKSNPKYSPVKTMEHDLHLPVSFFILPVFAFANSGINFSGMSFDQVLHPVPVGIALGLFIGKQLGVFSLCWLTVKLKLAELPKGMNWASLYGLSALCGIGFTMSLFIGALAFKESTTPLMFDERLGIICGSLLSGLLGFFILKTSLKKGASQDS